MDNIKRLEQEIETARVRQSYFSTNSTEYHKLEGKIQGLQMAIEIIKESEYMTTEEYFKTKDELFEKYKHNEELFNVMCDLMLKPIKESEDK